MENEYLTGQRRDGHPQLIADFEAESLQATDGLAPKRDIAYGEHERQVFDLFLPRDREATTVLCYYHAGYWQSRDKSQFRFIAEPFVKAGLAVALVNYPLCPDVTFCELVQMVKSSPAAVQNHLRHHHGLHCNTLLVGHSAGAHLVVEMAETPGVLGIVGLSGVYDLLPLIETSLNERLQLDPYNARQRSVVGRQRDPMPAALFAAGASETTEFLRQTEIMDADWRRSGSRSTLMVTPEDDHFTILRTLCRSGSTLHQAVLDMAR